MSLSRWFKSQVYWLIPDSFKSQDINEFDVSTDLVTIYKTTDQDGVYENKKVSVNQLNELVGLPYKSYVVMLSWQSTEIDGTGEIEVTEIYNNLDREITWVGDSPTDSGFTINGFSGYDIRERNIFHLGYFWGDNATASRTYTLESSVSYSNFYLLVKDLNGNLVTNFGTNQWKSRLEIRIYN